MSFDRIHFESLFTQDKLDTIFPADRSDAFFDALLGDASEGAYDIRLTFDAFRDDSLMFNLELRQRPGRCLACNLTYGLPTVFARHPVIDIQSVVQQIGLMLPDQARCGEWKLGVTREVNRKLHAVPLIISLE